MENDVPPETQLRPMPTNRFAQPPLQPIPFDRASERARNRQSDPAGLLAGRPGKAHQDAEVPSPAFRVHFAIVGSSQQSRLFRETVLSLAGWSLGRRPDRVCWPGCAVSRSTVLRLGTSLRHRCLRPSGATGRRPGYSEETVRRLRPCARRRESTFRPPGVSIRDRNPWVFARFLLFG